MKPGIFIAMLFALSCGPIKQHAVTDPVAPVRSLDDLQVVGYDFVRDVIFKQGRCLNCHSGDRPSAGVNLDQYEDLVVNSDILVPQEPQNSPLYLTVAEGEMPPAGNLPEKLIQGLERWIREGALKQSVEIDKK